MNDTIHDFPIITMVEVVEQLEAKYGHGTELRLRRTGVGRWVASAWVWAPGEMLAASDLCPTPEVAIRDLLGGTKSG